jgi:hypothetical protein
MASTVPSSMPLSLKETWNGKVIESLLKKFIGSRHNIRPERLQVYTDKSKIIYRTLN